MANTTNFGWETPDDTDLVKDGAAAMRTLGSAIDTSMMDLKGGTSGQVLSKNSNTDMDFVWVTSDDANAIQNAIVDAKGDLITATAADTPARLAVGTNGQVLTADSTTATGLKWAAVAAGGKVLQVVQGTYATSTVIASTTYTDSGLSLAITPSAATSKILILVQQSLLVRRNVEEGAGALRLLRDSTAIFDIGGDNKYSTLYNYQTHSGGSTYLTQLAAVVPIIYLDSPNTTSSITYKTQARSYSASNSGQVQAQYDNAYSSITLLEIGA